MSCFSCFNPRSKDIRIDIDNGSRTNSRHSADSSVSGTTRGKGSLDEHKKRSDQGNSPKGSGARSFTFRELATATRNFRETNLLGEGGFGRVYKDSSKKAGEQNLVAWSRPFLKDQKKFGLLVDPLIRGRYPRRCLNYAIAITAMCLNEEANFRPLIGDIVVALEYLASQSQNWSPDSRNVQAHSVSQVSPASPIHAEKNSLRRSISRRSSTLA
ncbi:hypothetical protein COLO4_36407 [Corchorus olitorius]|uniref:Protein kinase domain-containing protein n=1 Tax=Corchorus olitorius TaxID=93759 RepID=A0A1R3G950_9ROSI|nr:hypothetical protein COLO4_36407 [Corchorus olitorius]